jgi:hypothetical protein
MVGAERDAGEKPRPDHPALQPSGRSFETLPVRAGLQKLGTSRFSRTVPSFAPSGKGQKSS